MVDGTAQKGQACMEVLMVWPQLGQGKTLTAVERLRVGTRVLPECCFGST